LFIKWRTYQRQLNGIKGDEYIQRPIIVKSFRIREKGLQRGVGEKKADHILNCVHHEKVMRPRHKVISKLPSYPVCMFIYFPSPEFIKQSYQWWERVDSLFAQMVEKWPDTLNEDTVKKLKDDIEKVVPRLTEVEIERPSVVLNDLQLHL